MKNFIELTSEGEKVYINRDSIIMVMINNKTETYLRMTFGYSVVVDESYEDVIELLTT